MQKDFEQIPHTADIKIRVFGDTINQLFANAMIGMFQSVVPVIPGCQKVDGRVLCDELPIKRTIDLTSVDRVALLVDFLSEALYLSDVHNEVYLKADVTQLSDTHIHAIIHGVPVKGFEVVELKAVTYHDLVIKQIDDHWQAEIVFDI